MCELQTVKSLSLLELTVAGFAEAVSKREPFQKDHFSLFPPHLLAAKAKSPLQTPSTSARNMFHFSPVSEKYSHVYISVPSTARWL